MGWGCGGEVGGGVVGVRGGVGWGCGDEVGGEGVGGVGCGDEVGGEFLGVCIVCLLGGSRDPEV